jgi:hypothetical protein
MAQSRDEFAAAAMRRISGSSSATSARAWLSLVRRVCGPRRGVSGRHHGAIPRFRAVLRGDFGWLKGPTLLSDSTCSVTPPR